MVYITNIILELTEDIKISKRYKMMSYLIMSGIDISPPWNVILPGRNNTIGKYGTSKMLAPAEV